MEIIEVNKELAKKAQRLVREKSKRWLAKRLGLTEPTITVRLTGKGWKYTERAVVEQLYNTLLDALVMKAGGENQARRAKDIISKL